MNKRSLLNLVTGPHRCRCPDVAGSMRHAINGTEPGACPVHDAEERRRRAEADSEELRLEVWAQALRNAQAEAPAPPPSSGDPLLDLVCRKVGADVPLNHPSLGAGLGADTADARQPFDQE